MPRIWTIGELLVEIMRPTTGVPLNEPGYFRGPFPSGAPAIFIDCAARLGLDTGIIGAVGDDDFGRCLTERLEKDGVDISHVAVSNKVSSSANVLYFRIGFTSYKEGAGAVVAFIFFLPQYKKE